MTHLTDLYRQEQELLKQYPPEQLVATKKHSAKEVLQRVGIDVDFGFLPKGYTNFYHQDFIVEEIDKDGKLCTIEPQHQAPLTAPSPDQSTLYADLVKTGMSTLEAVDSLIKVLKIAPEKINYAGIKDKLAVTSQRLSIEGLATNQLDQLGVSIPGLFLKNLRWGAGNIYKGNLRGNRFIITVRTPSVLGEGWLNSSLTKVRQGFYNFYYLQRFGTPRLLSHDLGRGLLQSRFEAVVKTFMTDPGVQDVPLLSGLRQRADQAFGDWEKVEQIFSVLPYSFKLELDLARHLKNHPSDFLGALKIIPDQLSIWIYAYASYLFNKHLSSLINNRATIPKRLPLLLNPKYANIKTYAAELLQDGIMDIPAALDQLFGTSKIRPQMRTQNICATIAPVRILKAKIVGQAAVLGFELGIGTYATTFLSHFFELERGLPLPTWVDPTKVDAKQVLGLGSVIDVEKVLGQFMFGQGSVDNYFY